VEPVATKINARLLRPVEQLGWAWAWEVSGAALEDKKRGRNVCSASKEGSESILIATSAGVQSRRLRCAKVKKSY